MRSIVWKNGKKRGTQGKMGFEGQNELKPARTVSKSVFIDRKNIADSRNSKFPRFFKFLGNFLIFQQELKLRKIRKNGLNFKFLESAIFFLSIKTLFETVRASFSSF